METFMIFEELLQLKPANAQRIVELQTHIYKKLNDNKDDVESLILLMQTHIMLAKKEDAISLANKIWQEIDEVDTAIYILYINNLINIGLFEMASSALKPFFEDMEKSLEIAENLMIKFATLIGSLHLMLKIASKTDNNKNFVEVANTLKQAQYQNEIKNISKQILQASNSKALSYEVFFYDDEDTIFWGVDIYVNEDEHGKAELKNKIESGIDQYIKESNHQYLFEPKIKVLNIKEHPELETL